MNNKDHDDVLIRVNNFCEHIENMAHKNNVSFKLIADTHIPYPTTKDLVNGYVIEYPERQLAVAIGKKVEEWLPTLIHESSHLDQLIENSSY